MDCFETTDTPLSSEEDETVAACVAAAGAAAPCARIETFDELDHHIEDFADILQRIGDDAQIANADLRNTLAKQQQALRLMTDLSTAMHDTAMAIIRRL